MADNINTLVGDNDAPATWTDVNDIAPDQKVLIGTIDERSGNMKAEWRASSQAAVFKEKTITENSVYDPQQEGADGYSMVTVEVPNTYVAADEGKVVSGGALVAQTARSESLTENGTYDTTENNSVTVNVSGTQLSNSPAAFTLLSNVQNLDAVIPDGITSINANAFVGCTGLTSVIFPASGMTTIGTYAFQNCTGLTSVDIPASVTSLGTSAFNGCSNMASVTLNSTALTIGNDVFRNCTSLTTVTIPEGTTTLGENVFRDDTALTTVTIPSTVTAIGQRTFNGCTNLATVTIAKAEGSITGAPWGAPETAQIVWTGE